VVAPRGGALVRIGNSEQVVVPINVAPSFSIGNPIPVVVGGLPLIGVGVSRPYDVTREIVVNWFEEI
jgi:hypothetical protein